MPPCPICCSSTYLPIREPGPRWLPSQGRSLTIQPPAGPPCVQTTSLSRIERSVRAVGDGHPHCSYNCPVPVVTNTGVSDAEQVLRRVFGYDSFRPGQQEIIEHVIGGGDALVLMPTGGGKSLCYQVPALVRPGTGVVVSPLIALMQDQVDALQALDVRAGFLNSSQDQADRRQVEAAFEAGELDLLYLAPERLRLEA